jgi:GNAT superfamily N-acetyltransferase
MMTAEPEKQSTDGQPTDRQPTPHRRAGEERFRVVNSQPWMAEALEMIQAESFPSLSREELIRAEHYRRHLEVFAEGQHAVVELESNQVVACSTDFRTRVNFIDYQHRYIEIVDNNWLGNHDPEGDWLYGADIGVLPAFRGLGLAGLLYRARHALIKRLGLRGHVAGAMPKGFGAHQSSMSIQAYLERVQRGELEDRILNVMLRRGYRVHGVIENYLEDPSCANYGVFMVWENGADGRQLMARETVVDDGWKTP